MGRNCHRCPYTGGCWPECKLPSATWATNRTDATPASNGEAAGAVNAEMLAALEHARHKMWEYGFSEDDLAPVREAIAKAEAAANARHTKVIEDFEVWADNWPTWEAFRRVETQWLYAGLHGQRTGLNYPGVEVALGLPRVRRRRAAALFEDITLIEHAVLAADYELAQKRK